jgi:pyruvate,water dikinase
VLTAVKKCWASLWTSRAIAYRLKNNVDQKAVALAVVVQELVDAQKAGIMFTTNPVSGDEDEIVINAAWGLGEAVVGGKVSPDSITADKASGKVKTYEIAEKTLMTVRTKTGTTEKTLKGRKRKARVLSDDQIAALAGLAREIEAFYGSPQDIEWGWRSSRFYILQSRPVTTTAAAGFKADWTLPDPKGNYIRASLAEHLPNAVTPLFSTLGLRQLNASTVELADSMNMKLADANYMYMVMNGYVYMSYKLSPGFVWEMIKVTIENLKIMMTQGAETWQKGRQEFSRVIAKWEQEDSAELTPSEILKVVRELMYAAGKYYTIIQSGALPSATSSEMLFSWLYKRVKRPDDPEASQLLLGLDSVALQSEKSLLDMAAWVDESAAMREYFQKTTSSAIVKALHKGKPPAKITVEDWEELRMCFDGYMHKFGNTSYEFDFVNPSPAEMPELTIDTIKVFLEGKSSDPYERQQEADALREKTISGITGGFHLIPNRWFKKAFDWVIKCAPIRENALADMGMGHATVRRYLNELGRRLAAQGSIDQVEDIYWLFEEELEQCAACLEEGRQLPDFSDKVPERRQLWHAQMKLKAPAVLPLDSPFASMIPWARDGQSDHTLKGVAASAGSVTGTARVLFGPEDFERMQPGDILVAVTTTPAWTPLFTIASAVVTDIGGPLSHSSIVAREYGIPAVLATGSATRVIQDGQIITVDGNAGVVTLD